MRNAAFFIASQSETRSGLLGSAQRTLARLYRNWKVRRQIARLSEFDDHMLADIGLTREDVDRALDLPFANDPGRELQFRATRNVRRGWNV